MTNADRINIKFWRKMSTNKKLIFAIPQVVEMIDMLEAQAREIVQKDYLIEELEAQCEDRKHNKDVVSYIDKL
jgi:hypothetical protein